MEHPAVAHSDTHMPYIVQVREGIRIIETGHAYVIELLHRGRWTPSFKCETEGEARSVAHRIPRKPALELVK